VLKLIGKEQRAIDDLEGTTPRGGVLMDQASDSLLSASPLSQQQQRPAEPRYNPDKITDLRRERA
jgi:hypothetical protein